MIRICLKCNAFYADESLAFCLVDGTPLVNLDPTSDQWSEGVRVVEKKATALKKHERNVKFRRTLMSTLTTMIVTTVVLAVAINVLVYVRPLQEPSEPSPTPVVTTSPSPSPFSSISSPTPSPSSSPAEVYKISGHVIADGKPLVGVVITLEGDKARSFTTDANGFYVFKNVTAGVNYTITPARANMSFMPPRKPIDQLKQDSSADFLGQYHVFEISGRVSVDNKPLGGVVIKLEGGKTDSFTTKPNGSYVFTGVPAGGHYTITPSMAKVRFKPRNLPITNLKENMYVAFVGDLIEECDKRLEEKNISEMFDKTWRKRAPEYKPGIKDDVTPGGGTIRTAFSLESVNGVPEFQTCTSASIYVTYEWKVTIIRPSPNLPPVVKLVKTTKRFNYVKTSGTWRPT